jgi:hypothetical protein
MINFLINKNSDINIIEKKSVKYVVIYNKNNFIKYKISKKFNFFFNKNSNVLNLKLNLLFYNYNKINYFLKNYIYSINFYFKKKIKFIGKSYKIKKRLNKFFFKFNKSHLEMINWKNFFLKKIKKNKILLKTNNFIKINFLVKRIINIRKLNIFNRRGLRCSKEKIYKKIGKKTA